MKTTKQPIEFTRINLDVNGNPRYVFHFTELINEGDRIKANATKGDMFGITTQYNIALNKAREIGGRKYHNKQYGGGIVVQSYNIQDEEKQIKALKRVNTKFIKEWTPKQHKQVEKAIDAYFATHNHKMLVKHGEPLQNFNPFSFTQIDSVMGLAYTSSSAYAGLFACNAGYIMANDTHHFSAFVINELGKIVAIVEDKDENEIYIEL